MPERFVPHQLSAGDPSALATGAVDADGEPGMEELAAAGQDGVLSRGVAIVVMYALRGAPWAVSRPRGPGSRSGRTRRDEDELVLGGKAESERNRSRRQPTFRRARMVWRGPAMKGGTACSLHSRCSPFDPHV
jgi:hypothetical protein